MLLAANESLVAYRRHHRSDVELTAAIAPAAALDVDNPRSFLACVNRLADHVAAIDWTEGRQARRRLAGIVDGDDVLDGVAEATSPRSTTFAALVVDTWFATPVEPDGRARARCDDAAEPAATAGALPRVAPHDVRATGCR